MCYATQLSPQSSHLYSELQALLSAVPLLQEVWGCQTIKAIVRLPSGWRGRLQAQVLACHSHTPASLDLSPLSPCQHMQPDPSL